ncbi:MAG: hypothetical protein HYU60_03315 [Magnetospirillum sp.]|nr:hypothetical protein [Magnetospirillum sp.]
MKTIRLFVLAIPALAVLATATVQAAEPSCKDNIAEVQKRWDTVYHRDATGPHPQVKENFRIAKERCAKGDQKEATNYLDVVRGHLTMPIISKSAGEPLRQDPRFHSESGPNPHHDPATVPAMGGKAGPGAPEIRPDGASAPNLGK